MIKFFDTVFYKVFKQYEKWGESSPYPFAEGIVVVFQLFLIMDALTILSIVGLFPRNIEGVKLFAILPLFIVYVINHHRYKKKYEEILADKEFKYDNMSSILVFCVIMVSIVFPLVIGYLRNNAGINI